MIGVIEQVRTAAKHPVAASVGAALGGFVPLATYAVAHAELDTQRWHLLPLVAGGLLFSAKTIWQWGKQAFAGDAWKATGFVLLVEGVMVLSQQTWLARTALGYLLAINAVATGCTLAQPAVKKRAERAVAQPKRASSRPRIRSVA